MSEPRKATIADAKAAWEAFPEGPDKSIRNVIDAMRKAGIECPVANMQRWKKKGWVIKERPTKGRHRKAKIEDASAAVSDGVKQHETKAQTRLEVIAAEEAAMKTRRAELMADSVQPSRLQEIANREILTAQILLAEQISRRAAVLVEVAPEIAAKMLAVLTEATRSTTIVIPPEQPASPANGDGAKVVDGRVLREPSPTQTAIELFKARQRQGVAA
jgi:hypothetical protein